MKFPIPLLLAFGLLLAQVQPGFATMQIPVGRMPCGQARHSCADHDAAGKPSPCALCFSCGLGCHLAVLTSSALPAVLSVPATRMASHDEVGRQRRDPPPLPPPRQAVRS